MSSSAYQWIVPQSVQGVMVIRVLQREIHGDDATESLYQELVDAVQNREREGLVLDFSDVRYLTSMGIWALLRFRNHVHERSGHVVFCELQPFVQEVLTVTKVITSEPVDGIPFWYAKDISAAIETLKHQQH